MDRREALEKLPELSAGCLDAKTEAAVRRWVDECPNCKAEWESLGRMVQTLQGVPESHLSEEQSRRLWARCNEAIFDKVEARRFQNHNPGLLGWMKSQPRWGWALLGGAAAILGASILSPDAATPNTPVTIAGVAPSSGDNPGALLPVGRPPAYAASLVDHHAQMAADPFNDRVGSTMVSFSASREARQ